MLGTVLRRSEFLVSNIQLTSNTAFSLSFGMTNFIKQQHIFCPRVTRGKRIILLGVWRATVVGLHNIGFHFRNPHSCRFSIYPPLQFNVISHSFWKLRLPGSKEQNGLFKSCSVCMPPHSNLQPCFRRDKSVFKSACLAGMNMFRGHASGGQFLKYTADGPMW